mmetsp:Transcript_3713/g.9314  ORF Transcript_3713/g.9314 Transcript_3713/m.9314 type:complete len:308 (+) Transcript_3713:1244-2167(+)
MWYSTALCLHSGTEHTSRFGPGSRLSSSSTCSKAAVSTEHSTGGSPGVSCTGMVAGTDASGLMSCSPDATAAAMTGPASTAPISGAPTGSGSPSGTADCAAGVGLGSVRRTARRSCFEWASHTLVSRLASLRCLPGNSFGSGGPGQRRYIWTQGMVVSDATLCVASSGMTRSSGTMHVVFIVVGRARSKTTRSHAPSGMARGWACCPSRICLRKSASVASSFARTWQHCLNPLTEILNRRKPAGTSATLATRRRFDCCAGRAGPSAAPSGRPLVPNFAFRPGRAAAAALWAVTLCAALARAADEGGA